jgi:hypothetical protein
MFISTHMFIISRYLQISTALKKSDKRFLARHDKKVSQSSADKDSKPEVRTRNQFSLCEKHEVAKYLVQNPNMLAKDIALLFSEKFKKPLTADTVRRIKSEGKFLTMNFYFIQICLTNSF